MSPIISCFSQFSTFLFFLSSFFSYSHFLSFFVSFPSFPSFPSFSSSLVCSGIVKKFSLSSRGTQFALHRGSEERESILASVAAVDLARGVVSRRLFSGSPGSAWSRHRDPCGAGFRWWVVLDVDGRIRVRTR